MKNLNKNTTQKKQSNLIRTTSVKGKAWPTRQTKITHASGAIPHQINRRKVSHKRQCNGVAVARRQHYRVWRRLIQHAQNIFPYRALSRKSLKRVWNRRSKTKKINNHSVRSRDFHERHGLFRRGVQLRTVTVFRQLKRAAVNKNPRHAQLALYGMNNTRLNRRDVASAQKNNINGVVVHAVRFFQWYRSTVCTKLAQQLRARLLRRIRERLNTCVRYEHASSFYNEKYIYKAVKRAQYALAAEERRARMFLQRLFRLATTTVAKQNKRLQRKFVKQQVTHIFAAFFTNPLTLFAAEEAIPAMPRYLTSRLAAIGTKQQRVERELFSRNLRNRTWNNPVLAWPKEKLFCWKQYQKEKQILGQRVYTRPTRSSYQTRVPRLGSRPERNEQRRRSRKNYRANQSRRKHKRKGRVPARLFGAVLRELRTRVRRVNLYETQRSVQSLSAIVYKRARPLRLGYYNQRVLAHRAQKRVLKWRARQRYSQYGGNVTKEKRLWKLARRTQRKLPTCLRQFYGVEWLRKKIDARRRQPRVVMAGRLPRCGKLQTRRRHYERPNQHSCRTGRKTRRLYYLTHKLRTVFSAPRLSKKFGPMQKIVREKAIFLQAKNLLKQKPQNMRSSSLNIEHNLSLDRTQSTETSSKHQSANKDTKSTQWNVKNNSNNMEAVGQPHKQANAHLSTHYKIRTGATSKRNSHHTRRFSTFTYESTPAATKHPLTIAIWRAQQRALLLQIEQLRNDLSRHIYRVHALQKNDRRIKVYGQRVTSHKNKKVRNQQLGVVPQPLLARLRPLPALRYTKINRFKRKRQLKITLRRHLARRTQKVRRLRSRRGPNPTELGRKVPREEKLNRFSAHRSATLFYQGINVTAQEQPAIKNSKLLNVKILSHNRSRLRLFRSIKQKLLPGAIIADSFPFTHNGTSENSARAKIYYRLNDSNYTNAKAAVQARINIAQLHGNRSALTTQLRSTLRETAKNFVRVQHPSRHSKHQVRNHVVTTKHSYKTRRLTYRLHLYARKKIARTVRAAVIDLRMGRRRQSGRPANDWRQRLSARRHFLRTYLATIKKWRLRRNVQRKHRTTQRRPFYKIVSWRMPPIKVMDTYTRAVAQSTFPLTERNAVPLPYTPKKYLLSSKNYSRTGGGNRESRVMTVIRNRRTLERAAQVYKAREAISRHWNKKNTPLRKPITLTHEELFKRDLYPTRKLGTVLADAKHGGSRRVRQSLYGKTTSLLPTSEGSTQPITYSNNYPRFPAKGRKIRSYDAFLRRQFIKVRPNTTTPVAQLRRSATSKLSILQSTPATSKVVTNTTSYLTKQQRQKLEKDPRQTFKSRLLVTSLFRAAHVENQQKIKHRGSRITPLRGVSRALLRQALLSRLTARQIRDLRISAIGRRVKSRNNDPLWLIRKRERRTRKARRYRRYIKHERKGHNNGQPGNWTFSDFHVLINRGQKQKLKLSTRWISAMPSAIKIAFRPYQSAQVVGWRHSVQRAHFVRFKRRPLRIGGRSRRGQRKTLGLPTNQRKAGGKHNRQQKVKYGKKKENKLSFFFDRRQSYWQGRFVQRTPKYNHFGKRLLSIAEQRLLKKLNKARRTLTAAVRQGCLKPLEVPSLYFKQPAIQTVVSAEDKERRRLYAQELNRQRYRRLSEGADAVSELMPQLIGYLLRRQETRKRETIDVVNTIRNLYWSLRLMLRQTRGRWNRTARTTFGRQLHEIKAELSIGADKKYFTLRELTAARMRFQPNSIINIDPKYHATIDWLKKAIPFFHEYYTEDPEKYGRLAPLPEAAIRAQPSSAVVTDWKTQTLHTTMETQYNRLLSHRFIKTSPRFERMLVDTKRAPLYPGFRSAEHMKTRTQVRHPAARSSFFQRRYTTAAKTNVIRKPSTLYTYRTEIVNRRAEKNVIPAAYIAAVQQKAKPRVIAQDRLQRNAITAAITSGGLDIRLLRAKSARSGAYLQRLLPGKNKTPLAQPLLKKAVRDAKVVKKYSRDNLALSVTTKVRNIVPANHYKNSNKSPLFRNPFRHAAALKYVVTPTVPSRVIQLRRKAWRLCQKPSRLTACFLKWVSETEHKREVNKARRPKKYGATPPTRRGFVERTRVVRRAQRALSLYAAALEKRAANHHFNARRRSLWRALTVKWMRKARIVRTWLRDMKYALKKPYWNSRVENYAAEYERFKPARLRLRKLIWHTPDGKYFRRGLWKAFSFAPAEKRNAPWLEPLFFKRTLYGAQRGDYRRERTPAETKSKRRLKALRSFFRSTSAHLSLKRKTWKVIRVYNQRLHRSAFRTRTPKAALKHFRKRLRKKPTTTGLEHRMTGTGDRLDVNLILLGIASTVFWARTFTKLGLLRVNGVQIRDSEYRLKPQDLIEWDWNRMLRYQSSFLAQGRGKKTRKSLLGLLIRAPKNFEVHTATRTARYLRRPALGDLSETARINARLFTWYLLDSGLGK